MPNCVNPHLLYMSVCECSQKLALIETVEINGKERIAAASSGDSSSPWLRVFSSTMYGLFYWNAQTDEASWTKPRSLARSFSLRSKLTCLYSA